MKKLRFILALIMLFTFSFPIISSAEENGGYITLSDTADARLNAAGDTLSRYMEQITGKAFPKAESGSGIKFSLSYDSSVPDNGYVIETAENEVSIRGNGTRGVIHGVYAFLEKYCGCDWYTSTLYSIPENKELVIPAGEKTEYKPFFEYTDTDWVSPRDVEYSLANGLNGSPYRTIPAELGGTVSTVIYHAYLLVAAVLFTTLALLIVRKISEIEGRKEFLMGIPHCRKQGYKLVTIPLIIAMVISVGFMIFSLGII